MRDMTTEDSDLAIAATMVGAREACPKFAFSHESYDSGAFYRSGQ